MVKERFRVFHHSTVTYSERLEVWPDWFGFMEGFRVLLPNFVFWRMMKS